MDRCLILSVTIVALLLGAAYIIATVPFLWIPVAAIVIISLLAGWKITEKNDWY